VFSASLSTFFILISSEGRKCDFFVRHNDEHKNGDCLRGGGEWHTTVVHGRSFNRCKRAGRKSCALSSFSQNLCLGSRMGNEDGSTLRRNVRKWRLSKKGTVSHTKYDFFVRMKSRRCSRRLLLGCRIFFWKEMLKIEPPKQRT